MQVRSAARSLHKDAFAPLPEIPVDPSGPLMTVATSLSLRFQRCRGLTLVELMVVISILAALVVLSLSGYKQWQSMAENGVCMTHIRSIGAALGTYTVDKGTWPQMPENLGRSEEDDFWEWWQKTMEPYGVAPSDWACPTDARNVRRDAKQAGEEPPKYYGTYVPTDFEPGDDIPYRWNQPWLMERTDLHGFGQNVLLPDGKIMQFKMPSQMPSRK